jgi:queuine/archaeosine tRNA-ribosyltransferase
MENIRNSIQTDTFAEFSREFLNGLNALNGENHDDEQEGG